MGKIIFTLSLCVCSLFSIAQVHVVDTMAFDSFATLTKSAGVEHLIGFQNNEAKPSINIVESVSPKGNKGGLKVFIENAEVDDIVAATVQVMDRERQVAGGVTDFTGFAYMPNIEAGTYIVVIRHINVGETRFEVTIKANSIYELRKELPIGAPLQMVLIASSGILGETAIPDKKLSKGGLKVFIENAELDEIIAATVQVMDGERQVAGGVTDFMGFVYIPNLEAGTYTVVVCHIKFGEARFQVVIKSNSIYELRKTLDSNLIAELKEIEAGNISFETVVTKVGCQVMAHQVKIKHVLKSGLKVFIENAEQDDIVAATVQVMDGERQVAGGVTDFGGFVYIPNIEAGTYVVVIRHIRIGEVKFQVTIRANSIYELREELGVGADCPPPVVIKRNPRAWDYEAMESISKGGLKVFIENAELDEIIAATVQVMDGERQVAGGSTDFGGFVYMPNIEAGTYVVVIRHINVGEVRFDVTIQTNSIYELKETLEVGDVLISCPCGRSEPMFGDDPFMTSYATEDLLRNPSVIRN